MPVEVIEAYKTTDGSRFFDRQFAERHDEEYHLVKPVADLLPKTDLKHGTYKQHDSANLRAIKRKVWELVLAKHKDSYPRWADWDADEVHPCSVVSRVLDGDGPLCQLWNRLSRFNFELGREYDQPYFALHPSEAKEEE